MTLHLAFVSPFIVLQIGDRLLTTGRPGHAQPWDALSNKSILVQTIDGRVAISYAGISHIGGQPTDEWLLDVITDGAGAEKSPAPDGHRPILFGSLCPNLKLNAMMQAIVEAIETDFMAEPEVRRLHRIEVLISGWSWGKRLPSTYLRTIMHSGNSGERCNVSPNMGRQWHQDPAPPKWNFVIGRVGTAVEPLSAILNRLTMLLGGDPAAKIELLDIERFFEQEIRTVAKHPRGDTVGTDLMAIWIPGSRSLGPGVRFLRDTTLGHASAFTPAYVGAGAMIVPPMQLSGGELSLGPVTVQCVPPLPPAPGIETIGSQSRRLYP